MGDPGDSHNGNPRVGLVIGIDDATPLEFWVAVEPGRTLQLDDVVAVDRLLPEGDMVSIYGVVTQVRARHEGAHFQSDVFLIADGVLPAEVSEAALIQPTRFEPEVLLPPLPGAPVRVATDLERDIALSFDDVDRKLPAGVSRNDEPVFLDLDFVDGTKGAHINISGISGVATKTSYATFLLYSMFNSGVLGAEAANTKAIIFNVKGEDLLFLDYPNAVLDPTRAKRYGAMGLNPSPFRDVGILAPPRKGDPNATPATGARHLGVSPFLWTVADFCRQGLLPFLFADAEDERQQYTIVIQAVTAQLARLDDAGDGAVRLDGATIRTFGQLVDAIEDKLLPGSAGTSDPDAGADPRWTGRAVGTGTVNAFVRRLASSRRHVEHLIRADVAQAANYKLDLDSHQVTVVDIHGLHDRA
ncbi:MAG: ATP-binding protein, partial [Actinomycetia bacterium]|nr:ATP-binding protein [Actinomycetes bacterium]